MRKDSRVSAVVLAAGASTRMGTVKQLLRLDGRPLLERALASARQSGGAEVIVVLGYAAEEIGRKVDLNGVKVVVNEKYGEGMAGSLGLGLSAVAAQSRGAIIMLADQPFVSPATLDRLIDEHAPSGAHIVIPTYHGFRGNPVLLDRSVFREVMGLRGDIGCRAIFGDHVERIVKLPVEDVGILFDIDRPDDYRRLQSTEGRNLPELVDLEVRPLSGNEAILAGQPELVIVGRDAMATTLVKLARAMRFAVTLVDPLLTLDDVPEADRVLHVLDLSRLGPGSDRNVVVASRGACDEEAIEQALAANSCYVGLVANRKRGDEVLRTLQRKGIALEKLAAVRVPAGLASGAGNPEEIALSIMAEIVAERRKTQGTGHASGVKGS